MNRKGNCWDNAAVDNFVGLRKYEFPYRQEFESMAHFWKEPIESMDYYNRFVKAKNKGLPPVVHRQQALLAA